MILPAVNVNGIHLSSQQHEALVSIWRTGVECRKLKQVRNRGCGFKRSDGAAWYPAMRSD